MKPISYVYSYINIPKNDWNDAEVDIWLYNGMKSIGVSLTQQNTKLIKIEDHQACMCEDYETLRAVVVKEDDPHLSPTELTVVDGNVVAPYPVVQQTVNDQIYAIYPLLPVWFPSNDKRKELVTWIWAKPRKIIFSKQCKECPTYCNDCEIVYDMTLDNCLYFPQIKEGWTCVNYLTYPKLEEFMIDETNQQLIDALAAYVQMNYYDVKRQIDYTQQNKDLFEKFKESWLVLKKHAQMTDLYKTISISKISRIMNDKVNKMLKTINHV